GQIYDSNSHLLAAAVTAVGGLTAYRGSIGDDPELVRAELARLVTQVDVIITSGGVSMGVHDVIKDVLRDSGTVEFVQVAMQPGKPQGLGVLLDGERRVPFFGLPGNPVSAAVSFTIFVRPVLRRMLGLEQPETTTVSAELTAGMRSPAGKVQFARARARMLPNDRLGAEPLAGQGSHFVADLAEANLLLIIPPDTTELSAGDVVHAILLEDDDGGVTAR
ncbi:MAG TPA: molybdopterin molybdotransferase MoeA, partial [Dermatophilaceae bacterium]|nr:molybdopterin molybdotransferase MoeA [Dermatophilaceae bacterium]